MPPWYYGTIRAFAEGLAFYIAFNPLYQLVSRLQFGDFITLILSLVIIALAFDTVGKIKYWWTEYIIGYVMGLLLISAILIGFGIDAFIIIVFALFRLLIRFSKAVTANPYDF